MADATMTEEATAYPAEVQEPAPEPHRQREPGEPKQRRARAKETPAQEQARATLLCKQAIQSIQGGLQLIPGISNAQQMVVLGSEGKASLLLTEQEIDLEVSAIVAVPEIRKWLLLAPSAWVNLVMVNILLAAPRVAMVTQLRQFEVEKRRQEMRARQDIPVRPL